MRGRLLTESGLYRPDKPLPQTSGEYADLMEEITGKSAVFPGDTEPVSGTSYLSDSFLKSPAALTSFEKFIIKSGGTHLSVERFSPSVDAPEKMFRIIFDFDLICQCAIFNTLGSRGSYDREKIYFRRFFQSDIVFVARDESLPVGLLTLTRHVIKLDINSVSLTKAAEEKLRIHDGFVEIPYFWLHGGLFTTSGRGIANTILFRFLSEELEGVRRQYMPVSDRRAGQIDARKGLIYILGHSDKAPPFHIFRTYFQPVREGIIRDLIFQKAFEFITPEAERSRAFFDLQKGVDKSAADPLNSYRRDHQGRAVTPEKERRLSSYKEFAEILGDGIGENAIYFLGIFDEKVSRRFHQRLVKRGVHFEILTAS